ncbi:MAG: heparan-alpha-glucosaminide N-acetyltransferase domain-containing protein, partial [Methanocorpusculum sp.]|nr:heparan-alpha-glucosaminide N-acetyltransferase domain-containing protein [Methanocorpusculum sp.]
MSGRYYELDAARGIALILMIIYHIIFCLYFFTNTVLWFNPITYSGAPIAFMFIFIAGISLVLSAGKKEDTVKTAKKLFFRGLYVLVFAAVVSLVTFIVYPQGFVVFGVLHLIGVGTILAIPFVV